MSLAYIRAYMDRASAEGDGPIRFVAATEGRKGDNIDLRMAGAQLDRYRSNPVFLFGHRYFSRQDLPIGRGEGVEIDGDRLLIDVSFDQGDEFAREVERKYRGGFMNAVSIGFDVFKWEGGSGSYWAGGVAEEWELLELSAVPVPMDAAAVVDGGRAPSELDAAVRRELIRLLSRAPVLGQDDTKAVDSLEPGPDEVQVPANPTRTDPGVDQDAARDLLASISLPKGTH